MSRLTEELEAVKRAVAEARQRASPSSPLLLGTLGWGAIHAPAAIAAQVEALETIQRMVEHLTAAVAALEMELRET